MGFGKLPSNVKKGIMNFVKTPRSKLEKMDMSEDLRNAVYKTQDAIYSGDEEVLETVVNQFKNSYANSQKSKALNSDTQRISGRFNDAIGNRTEAEMMQDLKYQKLKQHNFGR